MVVSTNARVIEEINDEGPLCDPRDQYTVRNTQVSLDGSCDNPEGTRIDDKSVETVIVADSSRAVAGFRVGDSDAGTRDRAGRALRVGWVPLDGTNRAGKHDALYNRLRPGIAASACRQDKSNDARSHYRAKGCSTARTMRSTVLAHVHAQPVPR